jgi:cytoskeletal protein RodZ
MITVNCKCGEKFHSDENHIGSSVLCKRCGTFVPIMDQRINGEADSRIASEKPRLKQRLLEHRMATWRALILLGVLTGVFVVALLLLIPRFRETKAAQQPEPSAPVASVDAKIKDAPASKAKQPIPAQPQKEADPLKLIEPTIEPAVKTPIPLEDLKAETITPEPLNSPDLGVDYAVVTSLRVNLREAPDAAARVLLTAPKGAMLVLLQSPTETTWYNVIDVKTNQEGWVNASAVKINHTQNRKPDLRIPGTRTASSGDPSLEVKNDSSETLTLKVGDRRYSFSPKESQTIHLPPGEYKYFASAPGVIPDFGDQLFQAGYEYRWRFYIVTTIR